MQVLFRRLLTILALFDGQFEDTSDYFKLLHIETESARFELHS